MRYFVFIFLIPLFLSAEDKSYSFYKGVILYNNFIKNSEIELNIDDVIEGIKEAHKKKDVNPENWIDYNYQFLEEVKKSRLQEANEYIKKKSLEDGIKEVVKDRIYYKTIHLGSNEEVDKLPKISYSAKTITGGKEIPIFEELEAKEIDLESTIKGFSEGLKGMKKGEKRVIYIHPDYAYGAATSKVPPNSLMIFEVEAAK